MNLAQLASRVAGQSVTALPVKHDTSIPLFEDETFAKDLAKLQQKASELVEGVDGYLEKLLDGMHKDGSVLPGELEELGQQTAAHVTAICAMLIQKTLGVDEEGEEDESEAKEPKSESKPKSEAKPKESKSEEPKESVSSKSARPSKRTL
jgi:hypothetical protein